MIHEWLKAGVWEAGEVTYPEAGTPQGGLISPLLSNVFLHEVLDGGFEFEIKPKLRGKAVLIRYADDFVVVCERRAAAEALLGQVKARFGPNHSSRPHSASIRVKRSQNLVASCFLWVGALWPKFFSGKCRVG